MNETILSDQSRFELLNYGLFQLRNIPTNFYYYFLKTFDPVLLSERSLHGNTFILSPPYITLNFPGTSFFVVSPIFFYLFRARLKERPVRLALIPIGVILVVLLAYFWPGGTQTGPRYLLDLLPFAFLVLLFSFKDFNLSRVARTLIIASTFLNFIILIIADMQHG